MPWNQAVVDLLVNKLDEMWVEKGWTTQPQSEAYWQDAIGNKFVLIQRLWMKSQPCAGESASQTTTWMMEEKGTRLKKACADTRWRAVSYWLSTMNLSHRIPLEICVSGGHHNRISINQKGQYRRCHLEMVVWSCHGIGSGWYELRGEWWREFDDCISHQASALKAGHFERVADHQFPPKERSFSGTQSCKAH